MSRQRTRSTSSTRTPGLWDEVERLGDYILDVLGSDSAPTTCSVHWVAHRLAEHMRTAKTAEDSSEREAARDAAALLIAQLWQARGGWPQGWPPDAVQEFTEGVRNATRQHYGDDSSRLPPWLSTLGELEALHWEERATWVNPALLEVGAETLQQALEAAPDAMPEPLDLDNIRWQLQQHGEAETWIAAHAQEGEDPSRRADRAGILGARPPRHCRATRSAGRANSQRRS